MAFPLRLHRIRCGIQEAIPVRCLASTAIVRGCSGSIIDIAPAPFVLRDHPAIAIPVPSLHEFHDRIDVERYY
jgi:hypothetical protein